MTTADFAYDVFLSHRSEDKQRVRPIAEGLRDAGLKVWFDEWVLRPGDDIYLAIEKGLEQSRTLVLCMSRAALGSAWVDLERSSALFRDPGNARRRFVPLLLEEVALPDALRRFKYVDYRGADEPAFRELLLACAPDEQWPSGQAASGLDDAGAPGAKWREAASEPVRGVADGVTGPSRLVLLAGAMIASLGTAMAILVLMLRRAELLASLGLVGNLYYLVLVPLGLAVAVLLSGVLRSYNAYTSRRLGGSLTLGGPIVAFALVVVLGLWLTPRPAPFAVTIFVHGEKGPQDVVLRNRGAVLLDLGGHRQPGAIGARGDAYFPGIPATFRGQLVSAFVEADDFELAEPDAGVRLSGDGAYLRLRRKAMRVFGYVKDEGSGEPIHSAKVAVSGHRVAADESGFFQLELPGGAAEDAASMVVTAPGFHPRTTTVVRGGGETTILLRRSE